MARQATGASRSLIDWEKDATDRIRAARARGLDRAVVKILDERADRSASSPLLFHEAYELFVSGAHDHARSLLDSALPADGTVGRDRAVLRAALAAKAGDFRLADDHLATADRDDVWTDRAGGLVERIALQAARARLTVRLEQEAVLIEQLSNDIIAEVVRNWLSPIDVVLPPLQARLRGQRPLLDNLSNSIWLEDGSGMAKSTIDRERAVMLPSEPPVLQSERRALEEAWNAKTWSGSTLGANFRQQDVGPAAAEVLECGWRRAWYATRGSLFVNALRVASTSEGPPSLVYGILGTIGLLSRGFGSVRFRTGHDELAAMILGSRSWSTFARSKVTPPAMSERLARIVWAANKDGSPGAEQPSWFAAGWSQTLEVLNLTAATKSARPRWDISQGLLALFVLVPDPLDELVHALAGRVEGRDSKKEA